ncbi:hypothetical protein GPJ56_008673 [Histomonas meleagridis]|uniref:uncharacterized protein n=1 Tax=Histomonas meleagridis TaxID=135588 RepID=UPI0035594C2B|nr:hypothetical protein GPJ56_008673 [Histomonas meleagridis]KAH0805750.1 hypothetical protein GO595_001389 [Histomonas meleagridis]
MKNFTIFPSSSSKNSILILIGNTVQEPFIGELSKLNVLYFLFVVVGVISDVYINKKKSNESLLFLSSAISIAVSLVRFSPEIRESISTSDFTQRLRNDYNTYSFSHKVEALRYVFSYIDFISESPAINLVMSFDIIAIISEMIYSDESEVLRMLLHTFSIALEDEINNATNPVLNALIEFSKTDDFYSAFQILLDQQEADIAEKAQLLIDHLAENDM